MAVVDVSNRVVNATSEMDGLTITFSGTFEKNGIRYVLTTPNAEGESQTLMSDDGITTIFSCPASISKTKKLAVLATLIKCLEEDVKPFVNK